MYNVLLASVGAFFDAPAEIPYLFKKADCNVHIFCAKESWLTANSFHDQWIEASNNEQKFAQQLIELVQQKQDFYNWVLLLDDVTVRIMNETITNDILFSKILPLTKIENRYILSSKAGLSAACLQYNIATPKFINYTPEITTETIFSYLQFPILLKENFSFSGLGIQFCSTPKEFENCLQKVKSTHQLVLQEFIEGEDIGVEAVFKDGKLVAYNASKILSYMYGKFSFTTRRLYYKNEVLAKELQKTGLAFGINGFASMQYIFHPQRNTYYLIEADLRANAWMVYSRFMKSNFIYALREMTNGNIRMHFPTTTPLNKEIEIAIFDRDFRRCIKQKDFVGICRWLFNYKGYWRFLPIYDTVFAKRIFKKMLKDLFKIKN